jgi:hypothetical protein
MTKQDPILDAATIMLKDNPLSLLNAKTALWNLRVEKINAVQLSKTLGQSDPDQVVRLVLLQEQVDALTVGIAALSVLIWPPTDKGTPRTTPGTTGTDTQPLPGKKALRPSGTPESLK